MPDNTSGESAQKETIQQVPAPNAIDPQPPPIDTPDGHTAQEISDQNVAREVKEIGDRIRRAEWLMIGLTGGIVLLTLGLVIVGTLQWSVMSRQLDEMKRSGQGTTDQTNALIGNMNWLARTMDGADVPMPNVLSARHLDRIAGGRLYAATSSVPWATLLARTFELDVKACARCAGRLGVRAVVTDHDIARRILAPIPTTARAPPPIDSPGVYERALA